MNFLSPTDLNMIWFVLVGILFTGYAILDGFDLGVGSLHLLTKSDEDRRLSLNSIGPVWDGNEVWLVTGGGALFAAFPEVYATVFSGFYIPFMLLLASLIFRAVAIEFRSKMPMIWWRRMWDVAFAGGSLFSAFLIGLTMGNIIWGIALDHRHVYVGSLRDLIHPYPLLVGVTTVALFMMHGCMYLIMKTEGDLQKRALGWVNNTIIFFIICYVFTTLATLIYVPRMVEAMRNWPGLFVIALLNALAIANIPREMKKGRHFYAFLSSCLSIVALMTLFGIGMFPYMVYSNPNPENSLTLFNAASSAKTHGIMLLFTIMGIPLVAAYTVCVYWIFRGKVKLGPMSY
ncbi:MAG: cytochrome d ubiquinol oxidase subunit II [Verrucomicrobiae bacterium]|nr:cytochrome d ubiquinol oxidase subunit II [Verrucomicrobiae bacterium]